MALKSIYLLYTYQSLTKALRLACIPSGRVMDGSEQVKMLSYANTIVLAVYHKYLWLLLCSKKNVLL